jgi:peptidyl-prolyl cis-trans isomerase C
MKRKWLVAWASAASVLFPWVADAEEGIEEPVEEEGPAPQLTPEDIARRNGVIAKVGDYEITIGEYEDRLNSQGPFRRVQYSAPEKRREFLDQMIEWELQAQEAERRGLGNDQTVDEQVKRVMSSLLLRREVDDRVRPTDVTAEEMRAYYEEHITTFKRPERVRAYHIVISDQTKAQELLTKLLTEEVDTREFRQLARELSEDPVTKRRGGDLRYFTRPDERQEGDPEVPVEIVKATFELLTKRGAQQKQKTPPVAAKAPPESSLEEGFTPIYPKLVKTAQGYHIVRFMGHREAVHREFAEVERQIQNRIWREKLQTARESFIEGLREKHRVTINEEHLKLVKVDTSVGPSKRPSPLQPGLNAKKGLGHPIGRQPREDLEEGEGVEAVEEVNE